AQRHIIKRPRLTKLLDEAEARIILLVAPAGYGKTTLAREWLARRGRQTVVYRVKETIDPIVVAWGLAAAVEHVVPRASESLREFLTASSTPDSDPEVLADVLAEDFERWPERAWLFIDDYQGVMRAEACERVIARFIDRLSPHALITSRERPRWIRSRAWLYGEAVEVKSDVRAMTTDEAQGPRSGGRG